MCFTDVCEGLRAKSKCSLEGAGFNSDGREYVIFHAHLLFIVFLLFFWPFYDHFWVFCTCLGNVMSCCHFFGPFLVIFNLYLCFLSHIFVYVCHSVGSFVDCCFLFQETALLSKTKTSRGTWQPKQHNLSPNNNQNAFQIHPGGGQCLTEP